MNWTFLFQRITAPSLRSLRAPESVRQESSPEENAQISRSGKAAGSLSESSSSMRLSGMAYLEILVLGGLIPAALLWLAHGQVVNIVLPSLVLGPLLLGLHYGFFAGTCGALSTAVVLAGITYLKPELLAEFPRASAVGLLLVGMGSGEARDIWAARLQRLNYLCHYHQTRLKQFTSDYQLLQVSHLQLERRVAGGENNLRTALERLKLRKPISDAAGNEPLGGIGDWVLEIMAEAGNLHIAAVYEMNGPGILRLPSVAMLGKATDMSLFNPLLRETLHTGSLTSVRASNEAVHEHVIAVVPLIDASGHIHGIVSINDMPFLSIHQDTFELLGVLGRHIGDILSRRTRPMKDAQGPFTLREGLQRNLLDARKHAFSAALIACKVVDAEQRDSLVTHCCHSSRGLDQSWISINRKGETVILKLLPLTDEVDVKSYLARLESKHAGGTPAMHGIITYLWMLDKGRAADEILAEVCVVCDIDAQGSTSSTAQLHWPSKAAL
ncbi:MAG: PelD GGDEF domain-containing protein [Oxalobacteraceae bacterium]